MSVRTPFRRLAARLTGRRRDPAQKAAWLRRPDRRDFIIAGLSLVVFGFLVLGYLAYTLPLADPTRPERRMSLLLYTSSGEPFGRRGRSEEHTSELQSLMRISYAVFCLKKKKKTHDLQPKHHNKT